MQQKQLSKPFSKLLTTKFKLYFLIGLLGFLVFFASIYANSYYQIKAVQIEGDIKKDQLIGFESLRGTNFFLLNENKIKDLLSSANPSIKIEEVKKIYPNKLYFKLTSLDILAQLKLNSGYAQLSEQAKIVKKTRQEERNLPLINFYQKFDYNQINSGETLAYQELITTLFLLKKSGDLGLSPVSIDISGLSMILFNIKDPRNDHAAKKIYFSAEKDRERQATELETLLIQFKIKSQDFKIMDLRFDKPVVTF